MKLKRTIASITIAIASLLSGAAMASAQPITEDESGWDCTTMGNMVCGPGNGVQPGQYEDGALIAWPHQVVPTWCKDICLGA